MDPSTAAQIRVAVKVPPHPALVTVETTLTNTLVALQLSKADGGSKSHAVPHSTALLLAQIITGGVRSRTITRALHELEAPRLSQRSGSLDWSPADTAPAAPD